MSMNSDELSTDRKRSRVQPEKDLDLKEDDSLEESDDRMEESMSE